MENKIINKFGTHYLLGQLKDGDYIWLEEPTFDCGWYWGGLYLHTYTNNRQPTRSKDISSHTHFDTRFLHKGIDKMLDEFNETVLCRHDTYKLLELASTFYTLRKAADLFESGSSNITHNDCYDTIKDQNWYLEIIQKKLPAVISEICNLLGGETKPAQFEKQAIYKQ